MALKLAELPTNLKKRFSPAPADQADKPTASSSKSHEAVKVVVVGAGFGGLNVTRDLANHEGIQVLILDRTNYHGFWPLLYQVATAGLEADAITFPVRELTSKYKNTQFKMAEVKKVDLGQKRLEIAGGAPVEYDYLVLAAGSANNFFNNETIAENTYSLKDVDEAVAVRQGILASLEQAVLETDQAALTKLLTFVIVGAGPTGVELAGSLAELLRPLVRKNYPTLPQDKLRLVVVEAHHTLLKPFPASLQKIAQKHLEKMGVELRSDSKVKMVKDGIITFDDNSTLEASTVIWAAGVKAATLGRSLGIELAAHSEQVPVEPTLNLKEHPEVFVIGDMSYLKGYKKGTETYPMVAPVAIQQGHLTARNIVAAVKGQPLKPFKYFDKGNMSTLGRHDAVVDAFGIHLSGQLAWFTWLIVHLYFLIGVRNRVLVVLAWAYNYLTFTQGARLVGKQRDVETGPGKASF